MLTLKYYIWIVAVLISFLGFFGQDPLEFMSAILMVPILFQWFYRPGEPPLLLFGFLLQWISISLKILFGFINNTSFIEIMPDDSNPHFMKLSFYLSLLGLFTFALGTFLIVRRIPSEIFMEFWEKTINRYKALPVLLFYITYLLLDTLLLYSLFLFPWITSFIVVFNKLKWGFFLITFYLVHKQNSYKNLFYIVILVQFVLGFGYFSNFKDVIYYSIIGFITVQNKFKSTHLVLGVFGLFILLQLAVFWTSVKSEYRFFLTGGKRSQAVIVSRSEAINKLYDLSTHVEPTQKQQALYYLVDRISYIDYFSLCLAYVPEVVPFENGKVWKNAVYHILVPRFMNPHKKIIDDSEHTTKYTGRTFQGGGIASFSLGYTADAYIDFGKYLMFLPILLIGLLVGWLYRYLLLNSFNIFWGIVFVGPFMEYANVYGMNTIKILGWMVSYFLLVLVVRFMFIRLLNPLFLKIENNDDANQDAKA